jgi:hypothetical protein
MEGRTEYSRYGARGGCGDGGGRAVCNKVYSFEIEFEDWQVSATAYGVWRRVADNGAEGEMKGRR